MTPRRAEAHAMAEHPAQQPDLAIGSITIRGQGLSPATGQNLATAIAAALARQLPAGSARIDAMTASVSGSSS